MCNELHYRKIEPELELRSFVLHIQLLHRSTLHYSVLIPFFYQHTLTGMRKMGLKIVF